MRDAPARAAADRHRHRRVWPSAERVVSAVAPPMGARRQSAAFPGDQRQHTAVSGGTATGVPARCGAAARSSATSFSSGRGSFCSRDAKCAFERSLDMRRASSSSSSHRLPAPAAAAAAAAVPTSPAARRPSVPPDRWGKRELPAPPPRQLSLNPKVVFVRSAEDEDVPRRRRRRSHSSAKLQLHDGSNGCPNFGAPLLRHPH